VRCRWCEQKHGLPCPWVKAIEFNILGRVRRVEFVVPADHQPANTADEPEPSYPRYQRSS
jgi:hypothetical protein